MGALPTDEQISLVRGDLENYLRGKSLQEDFAPQALATLKRDLSNRRGLAWATLYQGDTATGHYLTPNNQDQLQELLCLLITAKVFEDAATGSEMDAWDLMQLYQKRYASLLLDARLDTDTNKDGTIAKAEELNAGRFLRQ